MKRKLIDRLIEWKENNSQFPLYITGARGVGKTYLALEFAKNFYSVAMYMNFETDPYMNQRLAGVRDEDLIYEVFRYNERNEKASYLSLPFHDKSTLVECRKSMEHDIEEEVKEESILILDEILYCQQLDRILRCVIQSKRMIHIILISSVEYIPPCIHNRSIEVVQYRCFPLDFEEFLLATGNEWYIGVINSHFDSNQPIPEIVHKELLELYEIYLLVGGIPETVNEYLIFSNMNQIVEKHRIHCETWNEDLNTWFETSEAFKMRQVVATIPIQLLKKNKKFQYTLIRKGVTKTMYEEAINQLQQTYSIVCSRKMTDDSQVKLYYFDTGILSYCLRNTVVERKEYTYEQMKSALLENNIAKEFFAKDYELHFWESDSSAKIDFILGKNHLLPVELFLDDKTRSKNISVFRGFYDYDYSVKISSKNFEYKNKIKYVPYYAVHCL